MKNRSLILRSSWFRSYS